MERARDFLCEGSGVQKAGLAPKHMTDSGGMQRWSFCAKSCVTLSFSSLYSVRSQCNTCVFPSASLQTDEPVRPHQTVLLTKMRATLSSGCRSIQSRADITPTSSVFTSASSVPYVRSKPFCWPASLVCRSTSARSLASSLCMSLTCTGNAKMARYKFAHHI